MTSRSRPQGAGRPGQATTAAGQRIPGALRICLADATGAGVTRAGCVAASGLRADQEREDFTDGQVPVAGLG